MSRLIVVSNRVQTPNQISESPGGLSIGILGALKAQGGVWYGWSGEVRSDACREKNRLNQDGVEYITMDLTPQEYADYYVGFSNRLLWPLCHYVLGFVHYDRGEYEGYRQVNRLFAENLLASLQPDDLIWVHDYHLIPIAHELRKLGVQNRIGFFLHVPFPCYEMLRSLPIAKQLLGFLSEYNVVGVQTDDDLKSYQDATVRGLGGRQASKYHLTINERTVYADSFPIGVDISGAGTPTSNALADDMPGLVSNGKAKLLVGVDRIDYSKGLTQRLKAFHQFLKCNPDQHRLVSMMQIATVSRGTDPDYVGLRIEIEKQISRINGEYADIGWLPIHYLNRSISHRRLMQVFQHADICIVTSLRDGMNLVSKEFVCAQNEDDPGVLILSELAGSSKQLDAALLINPYDMNAIADAIRQAVNMTKAERIERYKSMIEAVMTYDIHKWRDSFILALHQQPSSSLTISNPDCVFAG